jgi:hypothetical protein
MRCHNRSFHVVGFVQYGTAIDLEGCKDKVRIIVSNRVVWREVKYEFVFK